MGVVFLSYIGSFWMHYERWGYWFRRPDLLDAAKTIVKVDRLAMVETPVCKESKPCPFKVDTSVYLFEILDKHYYNDLYKRLPRYLQSVGRLPLSFDKDLKGVADLHSPMMQSPIIATPDEGYSNEYMRGIILIGETLSGEKRAFITASGTLLAEDYAPYYEAIFKLEADGQSVQYLEGQRFFYDTEIDETMLTYISFIFLVVVFGCIPTAIVVTVDAFWSRRKSLT